jgi:fructosamine-3-kinase
MTTLVAVADGDPIRKWILEEGGASRITRISSVGGGCINTANRYETDVGSFFVKTNRQEEEAAFPPSPLLLLLISLLPYVPTIGFLGMSL